MGETDRIAMARFIFVSGLDRQARRHEWLRDLLFRLEALIVHVFWWSFRALSPDRAAGLGRCAVGLLGPHSAKHALVKANLSIAFPTLDPPAIDELARRSWRNIGSVFGEYPHLGQITLAGPESRLQIVDHCGLDAYRRRERQAIFVGAHVSNWEILPRALAREGVPLLALYAPLRNFYLRALMDRARSLEGCRMLARGEPLGKHTGMSLSQVGSLMQHVREGGSFAVLMDLSVKDGFPVPFFDQPMRSSLTPVRMAQRYGCDIVPVRTERLGPARFRVTAYAPLSLEVSESTEEANAIATTRRLNALIEVWIREQPDEWMSANRRWDKTLYRALGFADR